jgi:hypothetical protein
LTSCYRNHYKVTLKLAKPVRFVHQSPIDSVRSSSDHSGKGLKSTLASKGRKTLSAIKTPNYSRRGPDVKFSNLTFSKYFHFFGQTAAALVSAVECVSPDRKIAEV